MMRLPETTVPAFAGTVFVSEEAAIFPIGEVATSGSDASYFFLAAFFLPAFFLDAFFAFAAMSDLHVGLVRAQYLQNSIFNCKRHVTDLSSASP